MALPCARLGSVRLRAGAFFRCLCRSSSGGGHQAATAAKEIDIPRKKTWDKTAVLQALSYTVGHDPTADSYMLQDDPYFIPATAAEKKYFLMSKEAGKNAAKYILNMYPHLFQKDIAEPHIPCLMPENIQPQIEGVSEEALNERIKLRRVKESVDLFDQLLQGGTTPTLETTNKLLDLICFYGDCEPTTDDQKNQQDDNEAETVKNGNVPYRTPVVKRWRENNNAERIFNLMPEKNAHSYCTMIRGMAKHGASAKAFSMYTDLLNNHLTGDVYTYNALILVAPDMKIDVNDKSDTVMELLKCMAQQNVTPNLLTFNSIIKSFRRIGGPVVKGLAMETLMEMKALKIEPSLATYSHLLSVFYRNDDSMMQSKLLGSILEQARGKSFTAKDPDDIYFFSDAMKVCLEASDLDLAYELHKLLNTGDNWKLIGTPYNIFTYYSKLFQVVCMMENFDIVWKWYRELIPSRVNLTVKSLQNLFQVLEMENKLEIIPELWKDMKRFRLDVVEVLVKEILCLMASKKQKAELQVAFADIATAIYSMYNLYEGPKPVLESAVKFGNIAVLLTRAGRLEEAWEVLKSLKMKHLAPQLDVIMELLDGAKAAVNSAMAVDLVQLAASFSMLDTAQIAQRVLNDFTLTEEQRITLQDLTSGTSSSSSDSDSD